MDKQKIPYKAKYPSNIKEGLHLLNRCHDENLYTNTDFMRGYRMGLRMGINSLKIIQKHKKWWKLWKK